MERITRTDYRISRGLFAVAIFFGMNATTALAANDYTFSEPTVYLNGETFTNTKFFISAEPFAYGLYASGSNNLIRQHGDIFLTGQGAVGLRVDGSNNRIVIERGTLIQVNGMGGKGVWISHGSDNRITISGHVFSKGTAVEFSSDTLETASLDEFTLNGVIEGETRAIYLGKNSFVHDINIDEGAQIFGDIKSDRRASDENTNLNFNANLDYGGNISGADIQMHVNGGRLNFSGAANIMNVDVAKDATFFGSQVTAQNFTNRGTIGAVSPDTNLIINGDLVSSGTLQKVSGGKAGSIIVHGKANIDGSTVTTDSLLPDETAVVLVADSVTGDIANGADKPVPVSAMLSVTGDIVGNTVTVTTHESNNLGSLNGREAQTFDAMKNMYESLDTAKQEEMRELYNLKPTEAKQTLSQIGSNDAAQIMSVAQQSTAVDKFISNRITEVFMPEYLDVVVRPMNFAEDDASNVTVNVKVPKPREENFWLNYMKNWGSLRGGTDYHGSAIVGGYDRPFGNKWRAGIFATYGTIGYGASSSRATVYDTRLGLYAGYHNRQSDVYLYVNGGQLRNSLHRALSSLGLSTNANYKSRIVEFGGEYKYNLQPKRTWQVSPFINVQASYLRQNGYHESGAGIYNQHVDANSNGYFAAQVGLDLKRYSRKGMFGMRFGVKHGFTGADPDLTISYEGDGARSYRLRQERDKTHFVFSLRGENEFARGWFIGGEAELQLGEDDRDVMASVMLRRTW